MSVWDAVKDAFAWKPPGASSWDGWPWGEGPLDFEDDGASFSVSGSLADWVRTGDESAATVYALDAAVRIAVNFLATNIAHLKLKGYDRKSKTDRAELEPDEHALAQVLNRPNPQTSAFDLKLALVSDLALYDEAYWLKVGTRAVYRIPPVLITAKGGDIINGPNSYEVSNQNGAPTVYQPDEVVHFHWYNPLDTRVGLTRLKALRTILREEREASRHRYHYWKNAGRYQDIIERPREAGPWTDERRKRFREDWGSRYAGAQNAGVPQVIEDGGKYVQAGFSPKDSEFIAGREWALDIVATMYQIPLAMLSRNDSQAFASMREFHKILYTDVLGPWNAMIESTIDHQLVPDFAGTGENLYVEFNIDEKMQGDFEEQANAARSSVQVPWMAVDDMRVKRGMPPLGGEFAVPAKPANYVFEGDEPVEPATPADGSENVVRIDQAEGGRNG